MSFTDLSYGLSFTPHVSPLQTILQFSELCTWMETHIGNVNSRHSGIIYNVKTFHFWVDSISSTDFLSNLIVMLLRIRNAGLDDGGLLVHLSEATAGSLS